MFPVSLATGVKNLLMVKKKKKPLSTCPCGLQSPVSLLGDDGGSPGTPPPGCVDLSFLEEALLSSPKGTDDTGRGEVPRDEPPDEPPVGPESQSKEGEVRIRIWLSKLNN